MGISVLYPSMKSYASILAILLLILLLSSTSSLRAQQLLNSPVALITPNAENATVTEIISLSNQRPLLRQLIIQSGILATLSAA